MTEEFKAEMKAYEAGAISTLKSLKNGLISDHKESDEISLVYLIKRIDSFINGIEIVHKELNKDIYD